MYFFLLNESTILNSLNKIYALIVNVNAKCKRCLKYKKNYVLPLIEFDEQFTQKQMHKNSFVTCKQMSLEF